MDDQTILALFRERSESAIDETQRHYGAYLLAIASNILGSPEDAEEVVDDTYWRAWSSIPHAAPRSLKHYLSRITRNLALDRLAYRRAEKRNAEAIPQEDSAIFLLRYFYASTVRQIAAGRGLSERKVKYRLRVTRDKLRAFLEKEEIIL